ncbi:ADP-dependent glucokinase-like, partial [Uloborus diversus]|uniref:ADP-dependent glucokinase-like n=1 Tax=Uloborus diversus TaxID=327109 RepID=UPI002409BE4A
AQLKQLQKVQALMAKQPNNVRIHFEMASFSDETLLKNLVENIIPFADSLGMNEQELPNLYQMMKYGNVSLLAESRPRIAAVLDQMRNVFNYLQGTEETSGRRKLTRLHVHTLAFQAFLVNKESQWKNTKAAAAKSALTANRHTCGSDEINIKNAKLIMDDAFTSSMQQDFRRIPFETKQPVSCWDEEDLMFCVSPVLVCTDVLQTGGGGDNISSAGLVLQI